MDMNDLFKLISKDAPQIATTLLGGTPISGFIIGKIASLFGANADDVADIANKIQQCPDNTFKLRQLELQYQEVLQAAQVNDRMNARDREKAIVETLKKRDYVVDIIAVMVVAGFFVMCVLVATLKADSSDHDILYMLIGQLTAGFIMVLSYFYGSSKEK